MADQENQNQDKAAGATAGAQGDTPGQTTPPKPNERSTQDTTTGQSGQGTQPTGQTGQGAEGSSKDNTSGGSTSDSSREPNT